MTPLGGAALLSLFLVAGCPGATGESPDGGPGTPDGGTGGSLIVTGTVVGVDRLPLPSLAVEVSSGGFHQMTTTDAAGAFTVANVPTPYAVKTVVHAGGNTYAVAYLGLTRADPTVMPSSGSPLNRSATITGHLGGGSFPLGLGQMTSIVFDTSSIVFATPLANVTSTNAAGDYTLSSSGSSAGLRWAGPTSLVGTMHGLEWTLSGGVPVSYQGYGTRTDVTVTSGTILNGQDITLSAVTTGTLSGTTSVPAGYTLTTRLVGIIFAGGGQTELAVESSPATSFSYTTPTLADGSCYIAAQALGPNAESTNVFKRGLSAMSSGITVPAPAAPQLSTPADQVTNVNGSTQFAWSSVPDSVYVLLAHPSGVFYSVVTTQPTATLPDFSTLGLPFQKSDLFVWFVESFGPFADVDSASGPQGLYLSTADDWNYTSSALRNFTSAP